MKNKNKIIYESFNSKDTFDNLEAVLTMFLTNPMCINITIIDKTNGWYCGYMRDIFNQLKVNKIHTFKLETIQEWTTTPIRNKIELKDKNFLDNFDLSIYEEREKFLGIENKLIDY